MSVLWGGRAHGSRGHIPQHELFGWCCFWLALAIIIVALVIAG